MKYDEGMVQHIKDNYPKLQAKFLIDEYLAECDYGGGGISEPKHSYNWADHKPKPSKKITDLLNTDKTPTGKLGFNL